MNKKNFSKKNRRSEILMTIIIGAIGGVIFAFIHMPIPWMLGPMTTLLIASKLIKFRLYWPSMVKNWGLIIIGYASGFSINKDTVVQIVQQLPWMFIMTVALLMFTALTSLLISKLTGIDYPTIFAGGTPGGLPQMIVIGEEIEGLDLTVITFFQSMRLLFIVFSIPLIILSPLYSTGKSSLTVAAAQVASVPYIVLIPKIIIFAIISLLSAILAKKIKFPTPYLLGPLLGIAILSIAGFQGPKLSSTVLAIGQFSMGCYIGLLLKPEKLENKLKLISLAVINSIVLISFALGLSYILIKLHGVDAVSSFLCMAPGGASQMGLIASVLSVNVSLVVGYQLFRVLLVNFTIPFLLRWLYRQHIKCVK